MAAPKVGAPEFLKLLWGDTKGWAELTTIATGRVNSSAFEVPGGIDALAERALKINTGANVYMGVCLRREKWPRPSGKVDSSGKPVLEFRGTEANALGSWVVWCEFDFAQQGHKGKVIDETLARQRLKEFAFKPSVVVKSGGGIQVYWLLWEFAQGAVLPKVKAINKALAAHFGADPQSIDLARILRIPGTLNVKYQPARPCEISWWKPDNRYQLSDFDDLLVPDPVKVERDRPQGHQNIADEGGDRKPLDLELPEEAVADIAVALSDCWPEGFRHISALHVGGMMAWSGVTEESAKAIVRAASSAAGGDADGRVKDVESSYRKYTGGEPCTGKTSFIQMVTDEKYPAKEQAAHFLQVASNVIFRAREAARFHPTGAPPGGPDGATAGDVAALPIPDALKKVIKEGHSAYVEFRKSIDLPEKFAQRQSEGKMSRSEADCYTIGMLLQASVSEGLVCDIYRNVCNAIGEKARERPSDLVKYVAHVIDSVRKAMRAQPKWQITSIAASASTRVDREHEDQHFLVKRVYKYLQEPPTYDVVMIFEGLEQVVSTCTLEEVYDYEKFRKAYFARFDRHLPHQKEGTWNRMYAAAEHVDIEVEREEGTNEGLIEGALTTLANAAVTQKNGHVALNHQAVRMDDGDVVFKIPVVLRMLKDRGLELKKSELLHRIKDMGCFSTTKRFGGAVERVWVKFSGSNGSDAGNTPKHSDPPPASHPDKPQNGPVLSDSPRELFEMEASKS